VQKDDPTLLARVDAVTQLLKVQQVTDHIEKAKEAQKNRDYEQAAMHWEKAWEGRREDPSLLLNAAEILARAKEYKRAAELAQRAIGVDPKLTRAHALLAAVFMEAGLKASARGVDREPRAPRPQPRPAQGAAREARPPTRSRSSSASAARADAARSEPRERPPMPLDLEAVLRQMVQERASDLFLAEGRAPSARSTASSAPSAASRWSARPCRPSWTPCCAPRSASSSSASATSTSGSAARGWGASARTSICSAGSWAPWCAASPGGQLDFAHLGLPASVRALAESPRGLVLVSGSTGSGKSTTLAAMVHHINARYPQAHRHPRRPDRVRPRRPQGGRHPARGGLRHPGLHRRPAHVVRESPDVILIGEMRDAETMNVAISAALTGPPGPLVGAHGRRRSRRSSASSAYYPEHMREQVCMDLSLCLQGVVSQRLVPRADGDGRVAAVEVMIATPAVKKLIRDQRVDEVEDVMAGEAIDGMRTFNRALVELYEKKHRSASRRAPRTRPTPTSSASRRRGWSGASAAFVAEHEALPAVGRSTCARCSTVALRYGASDIHLVVGSPPIFRIHGKLRRLESDSLSRERRAPPALLAALVLAARAASRSTASSTSRSP
jgi:twitching motility protein PilT